MGEKVGHIIDFAEESGTLKQVVIDNRVAITKVACDIWEQNSSATELIGFDKKAVGALRPVIDLVLEKGFDPKILAPDIIADGHFKLIEKIERNVS